MIERIRKHKWLIHWSIFTLLVLGFVLSAVFFEHKTWLPNILQTLGTIIGMYLTLIIFIYSNEGNEKQFHTHLEHLQQLNHKQIEALQQSTSQQISALQELNSKQINALQELTEKQIEALNKVTTEQISSFEKEISEVTNKLTDNSILLAEILGRELENSITAFNNAVQQEEARYHDLSGWKLLRTPAEKQQQLNNSYNRIQQLKQSVEYLMTKYNQVRQFLGFCQKKLNG